MSLINRILLYRHSLADVPLIEPHIACSVISLAESELPRLHDVWPVPLDAMKTRLQNGDQCLAAYVEGIIAHYSWVQFSGPHEMRDGGQSFTIAPHEAWIYHCRTATWARGKGIYPFVLVQIEKLCIARGCSMAWIYTDVKNIGSQRGIIKAGFLLHRQLTALQLFSRNIPITRL